MEWDVHKTNHLILSVVPTPTSKNEKVDQYLLFT